jgi:hypothetical protein
MYNSNTRLLPGLIVVASFTIVCQPVHYSTLSSEDELSALYSRTHSRNDKNAGSVIRYIPRN